jgi:branched-chain amino acid transport system substrate-binding protein
VASFIPNTVAGVQAYVDPHSIPVVGGDGFTPWDHDPMLFNEGSSTDAQVFGTLQFSANLGKTKWAVFYCGESPVCAAGKDLVVQLAASAGVSVVDTEQVSVAQPNFTANCLNAQSKGAQVIYNINDASAMFRTADDCANQGFRPLIATAAASMNNDHPRDPNLEGMFGSSANAPWILDSSPPLKAFHDGMATYAASVTLNGIALQAWTSGELFKKAVENAGAPARSGPITSQLVLEGLWKMQGETLGGLAPHALTYLQGQPGPLVPCTFMAQIKNGAWTAPIGLDEICRS